jgi:pimeloyl-ACP methyl ester carboxylesterase
LRWRHAQVTRHLTAAVLAASCLVGGPAAAQLAFTPCTEPGQEAFDCATLPVPLDRSGGVAGTVALHVQRLRRAAPPARVLVALAGGPGESATSASDLFVENFEAVLDAYQLVVFDQRGTGLSGALTCPSPQRAPRCAAMLGDASAFYTTADSVADMDAVRAALGVETIALFGVSYGTWVAMEYSRAHPDRLSHLVLDSPLPPGGGLPLEVPTVAAVPRCWGRTCAATTRASV